MIREKVTFSVEWKFENWVSKEKVDDNDYIFYDKEFLLKL